MVALGGAMVDIGTLADLAETGALLAVLIFGLAQVRQFRRQRQDAAAMELIRAAQGSEFARNWPIVMEFPEGITKEEIAARGSEAEKAAMTVQYFFETIGVLVYYRIVPLHLFDHTAGGLCRSSWRKLRTYVEEERARTGFVSFAEWFQWLAERLEESPAPGKKEGAHVALRTWSP